MARIKTEAEAVASPTATAERHTLNRYWSWLDYAATTLRKACHGDARLRLACQNKLAARAEVRGGELRPEDVETLFQRQRAARDGIAARLAKADNENWDAFYCRLATRKLLPHVAEVMLELGAITAPALGTRPSQRTAMDDPQRMADADANANAWVGAAP
jgi:hypothetical protein